MKRRQLIQTLPLLALPGALTAQSAWPDRPVRLVVPYPPGASTDALGRMVAQKVSAAIGQPVVVENRAGASGIIGTEHVARAAPDGYTFLLGTDSTHASSTHMTATPSYHPIRDFTPLTLAAANPIVLVTHPGVPARTLPELVEWLRRNPDKGGFGSSGAGSPHHLSGELLRERSGASFVHVPYKGGAPAIADLIGGQISMVFASAITILPHVQSGRLRAIAVTSASRYPGLPEVATVAETYAGFEMSSWLAFFAPANLPTPIQTRLSSEIRRAISDQENRDKLAAGGLIVVASDPAELARVVEREFAARGRLIREAGLRGS
jgi:tripartite-type tricarboxylate transporter receptor subunit TctC